MSTTSRRGFTLIELLVVIAIIAILAAMLFPVFARARESARKIQCLSNVKNIAIAFQMYLTDYEKFPPREHRAEAEEYFSTAPGGGRSAPVSDCNHKHHANPFLRWPVVLDEYVRNRDVWRCPSAKMTNGASWIVPDYQPGGWLAYLAANEGQWGRNDPRCSGGPCCVAWPPGWGGPFTDSVLQGDRASEDTGWFEQTIGVTTDNVELKTSQITDPSWHVVCGDSGAQPELWWPTGVAFPDMCMTDCGDEVPGCCAADWVNCPDTVDCGLDWSLKFTIFSDQTVGKPYTRHMGGSNLGFADGHAAWMQAYDIIAQSPKSWDPDYGKLRGIGCTCLPPPPGGW